MTWDSQELVGTGGTAVAYALDLGARTDTRICPARAREIKVKIALPMSGRLDSAATDAAKREWAWTGAVA